MAAFTPATYGGTLSPPIVGQVGRLPHRAGNRCRGLQAGTTRWFNRRADATRERSCSSPVGPRRAADYPGRQTSGLLHADRGRERLSPNAAHRPRHGQGTGKAPRAILVCHPGTDGRAQEFRIGNWPICRAETRPPSSDGRLLRSVPLNMGADHACEDPARRILHRIDNSPSGLILKSVRGPRT